MDLKTRAQANGQPRKPKTCPLRFLNKTVPSGQDFYLLRKHYHPVQSSREYTQQNPQQSITYSNHPPKKKLNQSEIYLHRVFNTPSIPNSNIPNVKPKQKLKLFQTNHVPRIFKKSKVDIQNSQQEPNPQPIDLFKRKKKMVISKMNVSSQLSTNYEEFKEPENHVSVPTIIINAVKNEPLKNEPLNMPKLSEFQIGQLLGKGSYGSVRVARHKLTGFFYALKTYTLSKIRQNIERFIQTVKLQMYTKHPNIAQLYYIFREGDEVYLLMQICVDGDLSMNNKMLKTKKLDSKAISKGIVNGLAYLHQQQIIHRDIKLENILLCYGVPKITDFDLAIYQKNPLEYRRTFCGSPAYFSPQMLNNYQYNYKVDVWSLGIVIHEILCGYYPFTHSQATTESMIPFPENLPSIIKSFMEIMLVRNPDQRASLPTIIEHPYLS